MLQNIRWAAMPRSTEQDDDQRYSQKFSRTVWYCTRIDGKEGSTSPVTGTGGPGSAQSCATDEGAIEMPAINADHSIK